MNSKAVELGLESTSFTDPSGLKPENISSAYDLSRLITYASADERIAPIMRTAEYKVSTSRRTISIHNTNRLVMDGDVDGDGRARRASSRRRAIAWPRCCGCRKATRSRSSSSAPTPTPARFWETRHLFNWLSQKTADLLRKDQQKQRAEPATAATQRL